MAHHVPPHSDLPWPRLIPIAAAANILPVNTNQICTFGLVLRYAVTGVASSRNSYKSLIYELFSFRGAATSIGEQPVKGLISPEAGARLSVAEALTNLMFACITCLSDVKCSGNWMWPAKVDGK